MVNNPSLIVLAVGVHGLYDCMHHFRIVKQTGHVPRSYPPLCAAADFTICAIILWRSGHFVHYYRY